MKRTFFTADTHFSHKNIIKYCNRPYVTVEEMNEDLIKKWNERVTVHDTVYHLGDFGMDSAARMAEIRGRLNGRIFLLLGNHDYSISKKKWLDVVGLSGVHEELVFEEFYLNHLPEVISYGQPEASRSSEKRWRLCGHIHGEWRTLNRQLNVGVDVNGFFPIELEQARMEIESYDH